MIPLIVLGVIVLAFFGWVIGTFNGLVRLRTHTDESWAGIDTELTRRYDLIPNLVEVCKGYAEHEKTVFDQVTQARASAIAEANGVLPQAQRENALTGSLNSLFAVSEAYPDLKASEHFLALQDQLANTEDRIQAARRFYNANVRDLNTRVQQFPSSIIASMFGFTNADYFQVDQAAVRANPQVDLGS
ncbi:LemA family protein [Algisphaera agarilytica]|uniref:LemA protein n=1 Tax=Algisphaera agarilytica TaxID=1385975 RepID=A0A7X0H9E3_9BACT|nr:LemA family protein [Algisphaera agarilytica]MBB6430209.1 LemA protein [Algisphaera agarilytica]